ncbi:MAG: methyltransferase domain-containing protein [Acidobacteria bacterium]|nr:methyltransferase domain-containing protein [Acidobacteriota bacterium]
MTSPNAPHRASLFEALGVWLTLPLGERSTRRLGLELLLASAVVLFQELALIRWLPSQVRVLAYFPNLILLSAFLGLGVGSLRTGKRSLLVLYPIAMTLLVGATLLLGRVAFTETSGAEHLWLLYYDLPKDAPVVPGVRWPIYAAFLLSASTFVPLGQLVGERLEAFRRRSGALWGYSWDIGGSLVGIMAFTIAGFAGVFPWSWFALFLTGGAVFFLGGRKRWGALYLVVAVVLVLIVARTEKNQAYSPYYALRAETGGDLYGVRVLANGSLHQYGIGLRRSETAVSDEHRSTREGYHLPFSLLERPPRRALVLGAGTGNDVSVLLDEGAEHVDAVEIDPVILDLGRRYHPDRPYASPRVTVHNTDARSFLHGEHEPYDLIVFGTLDSMTRLSALSNVRLDNFVYTRQCLEEAKRLLAPDGGVVMYFMVSKGYILDRLTALHLEVFGQYPFRVERHFGLFNTILMSGPAFADYGAGPRSELAETFRRETAPGLEVPTDDWPFLYLAHRSISGFYLSLVGLLALTAVGGVALASTSMRRSLLRPREIDLPMLLFGVGFMLLETRSVTALNLVWGATWLTSAVVFGSILLMILGATLLAARRPLPWKVGVVGLVATLLTAWSVPVDALLGLGTAGRLGASVALVGAPIFFASICFALLFKERDDAGRAFGWNLLGAVFGGLLEFVSMIVGFRGLLLVALAVYLAAVLLSRRRPEVEA